MATPSPLNVVIAGGGTGGHLYPGIAVAREIRQRRPDAVVSFAGTDRGLEARVVPAQGFELDVIRSAGLKGKSWSSRLRGAALLAPSLVDAWRVLSKRRPAVVIGVGGYSSGPTVLLAALRGIPTMVIEQNAMPGFANRMLAPVVRAAAVTFDASLPYFRGKGIVTGNPVRAEFFPLAAQASTCDRVLVLGGSLGAQAINRAVVDAVPALVAARPTVEIVHQTGARDLEMVRSGYAGISSARAEAFLDPVATELASARLVVCRAGATTLAELAAAGRPAILIPFPGATDDHQHKNAQVLEAAGAAVLVEQRSLEPRALATLIGTLLGDEPRLARMRAAIHAFARPRAAADIVDRVLELTA